MSQDSRKDENGAMPDFKVTHYKVRVGEEKGPDRPFSAVFLSDLHNMSYGKNNRELLAEIRSQNPELVLIAGDMLTAGKKPQTEAAMALLDELTKKYPVYYANGNHEHRMRVNTEVYGESYERYSDAIKSFGVHLLENAGEKLKLHGMELTVWGLELSGEYFRRGVSRKLTGAQIEELIGAKPEGGFHILLAHHPCYFESYAAWGADLTLSGHLHGGIVRLPFLGGVISPQIRLFPRYDQGSYKLQDKRMIVSAGLGSHTIRLRINNPPELAVIDFV